MKKIALIIIIVAIVCMLTACTDIENSNYRGNTQTGGSYTHAYIDFGGKVMNVEIAQWGVSYEREIYILTLKDGTMLMVSTVNCILYNGTLLTTNGNESLEQLVIEDACKELEVSADGATLKLVSTEYVPWLGCNVYNYILTLADGSKWLVGARENEDGFYADVECQL